MFLRKWSTRASRQSQVAGHRRCKPARADRFQPRLEAFEDRLLLAVFTVTNTDDAGPGSLRQAILDANANPGLDTIAFAIGGGGVQTIRPTSALPDITDPVVLDGTTQPGYAGSPLIVLNGRDAGIGTDGLTIIAGRSTVQGLVINGFRNSGYSGGSGIVLRTNGRNLIAGNYIGTDATGTAAVRNGGQGVLIASGSNNTIGGLTASARNLISGNNSENYSGGIFCNGINNLIVGNYIGTDVTGTVSLWNWSGVYIQGSNNTVGGTSVEARNVISGNRSDGVTVRTGSNNLIVGNYIGTDLTGTHALGNDSSGVGFEGGTGNTVGGTTAGTRNVISGNRYAGIFVDGSANIVQGNYVGTDVTGSAALGNRFAGVAFNAGNYNLLGGTTAGAGNLLSGNEMYGVWILSARGNRVQGNAIGTDRTGTAALANGSNGVDIESASDNVIGGAGTAAGNLIAGNRGDGVFIHPEYPTFGESTRNFVQGNFIGTDVSGTAALGNAGNGVHIAALCNYNAIGGTENAVGNRIAFNGQDGVLVVGGTANPILRNVIFANTGLGIELLKGGNAMQEFPWVTTALSRGGPLTVQGFLGSAPSTTYTLEFFANTVCNPSGYGEGNQFLGSLGLTTDAGGTGHFSASFVVLVPPGQFVTATATDPDGNTSQFSPCEAVSRTPAVLNNHDRGAGSLREALANADDGDTIVFDAALAGQTITLTTGELVIDKSVDIEGPGADQLTISGNNTSRVFDIARAGLTVTIAGLRIAASRNSYPAMGGGIYIAGGRVTLADSILFGNRMDGQGGGIYLASGTLEINNSTLADNRAIGVFNAPGLGGGIYIAGGSVAIHASTLTNNQANGATGSPGRPGHLGGPGGPGGNGGRGAGGGIYVSGGSLEVTDSTLVGNQASGGNGGNGGNGNGSRGGNGGNGGEGAGGGMYVAGGNVHLDNSTLAGNQVSGSTGGAGGSGSPPGSPGLHGPGSGAGLATAGRLTVTSATLSGNSASDSGGGLVVLEAGTSTIRNTIVAANIAPSSPDMSGTLDSWGHNLIGDGTGGTGYTDTDLVGTPTDPIDPQLEPLGDYGGPTLTMRPLAASPAIDAGDNTDPAATDQRGLDRLVNGSIDIGSVELQPDERGGANSFPRQHAYSPAGAGLLPAMPDSLMRELPVLLGVGKMVSLPISSVSRSADKSKPVFTVEAQGRIGLEEGHALSKLVLRQTARVEPSRGRLDPLADSGDVLCYAPRSDLPFGDGAMPWLNSPPDRAAVSKK